MQTDLLKCDGYDIVMQEVPGEVSLAINVTECPHHCVGCHSAHLANSYGDYVKDVLPRLLHEYSSLITCVCFMGGDQHPEDLSAQCEFIKKNYPSLKIAIYSGVQDVLDFPHGCTKYMDYIKIGRYIQELGGLDSPKTNQAMYKWVSDGEMHYWEDITYLFWRKA